MSLLSTFYIFNENKPNKRNIVVSKKNTTLKTVSLNSFNYDTTEWSIVRASQHQWYLVRKPELLTPSYFALDFNGPYSSVIIEYEIEDDPLTEMTMGLFDKNSDSAIPFDYNFDLSVGPHIVQVFLGGKVLDQTHQYNLEFKIVSPQASTFALKSMAFI